MGSGNSKQKAEVLSKAEERREDVVQKTEPQPSAVTMDNNNAATTMSAAADVPHDDDDSAQQRQESKCPMRRGDGSYSFDWRAMFRKDFPHGPKGSTPISEREAREKVKEESSSESSAKAEEDDKKSGCPIKHPEYNVYSERIDQTNMMPKVANQLPSAGQTKPLSTDRVSSGIPKGGTEDEGATWTYPSPQMFYNSLSRKGKLEGTDEDDIANVVAIHNNMNEKTWVKIVEWEKVLSPGTGSPKLLKFRGRPQDLSPKAAMKHYLFGHPLPYDRHDWTILRGDGTTARYVIDYYHDESRANEDPKSGTPRMDDYAAGTPSLLVDPRPALDSPTLAWNRIFTMPYARSVAESTTFEPLPLRPTPQMRSQALDSVRVWQNAQQNTGAKVGPANEKSEMPKISDEEARELARQFAQIRGDCRRAQEKMDDCGDPDSRECAMASTELTTCMGKILCPLQYDTLWKTLTTAETMTDDDKIAAALETVTECVWMKSARQKAAKEQYPKYFKR